MKRAAIGVRMHSGWAVVVAVTKRAGTIEIIDRNRVTLTRAGAVGATEPYHFVEMFELREAEKFLEKLFVASERRASVAIRKIARDLLRRDYQLIGAALLLSSGRKLPSLSGILASHLLVHAAEGDFFRRAFQKACVALDLPLVGIRERELEERAENAFGEDVLAMRQQLSAVGKSLGPPWTKDQKLPALAACLLLTGKEGNRHLPFRAQC
jgi:hypothetical protein